MSLPLAPSSAMHPDKRLRGLSSWRFMAAGDRRAGHALALPTTHAHHGEEVRGYGSAPQAPPTAQ